MTEDTTMNPLSISDKTVTIKKGVKPNVAKPKPKKAVLKTIRLLDFHIYDEKPEKEESSGDEEEDEDAPPKPYEKKVDESQFVIQMFGLNEAGETFSLFVKDFQPFFFVKVGNGWTQSTVNGLFAEIKQKLGKYYENSIISAKLVEYNKLYGFTGGKMDQFAHFTFKNTATMNKVKNLWYEYTEDRGRRPKPYVYAKTALILYESSIPPLLRFFHIHNISPSGWVSVSTSKSYECPVKSTTCNYEYICLSQYIKPMPEKETRVPYKICSFDIEASSSHGDFPLPKKTYKRLAMNIVDVFNRHLSCQKLEKTQCGILCKKMVLAAFGFGRCDDIDLVYPKVAPGKSRVEQITDAIIKTPVSDIESTDASELLTLDTMFERMKEEAATNFKPGAGAGAGSGLDEGGDDGGDDDIDDAIEHVVEEIEPAVAPKYLSKPTKKPKSTITIIDILMSTEHDREYKVQTINEVLTAKFPALKGDEVTFIGSTFMRYGEQEPYLNHCVVLGSCDPVEGVEIETAETERGVLLKWTDVIQRENPDIIIGYNIFGFDYEFMFQRALELKCEAEFLLLSRKSGEICAKVNRDSGAIAIENTKIQLATGEYDLRYFKMSGRLQIDMYTYFRRDFNLSSYKLDDVAGQFISDSVQKIVLTQDAVGNPITELYSQNLMGVHAGDYIHIEIGGFTSDYYKDGKKFVVRNIVKGREITETVKGKEAVVSYNVLVLNGHEDVQAAAGGKSIKWGMAKDDVTPQDIFRLSKGSSADRAIVAKYCIQDCNLVHHLMNKIDVITGYVEMSSICSVPISFLVFRGQGIKLTSYVAKKCRDKNTLMPDLDKSGANEGYEGAIVLPPKCSMYMDNPVACVDYASLYPSSMISQNFSHDSKVWAKEYDLDGQLIKETGERDPKTGAYVYDNLPGYEYIDIEFDTFKYLRNPARPAAKAAKTKVGKMICRWAQFPENRKGIMPSILEELLKARANTRKMAKTEKDPFMQNILDKRQLGYKVTANSLYGQCGARTSTFYEKDVAACTTATGRMMITYAKRIIEEVYGDRVYETAIHGPVRTKAEYVYGDSVANYTPVYVRVNSDKMDVCTIEELASKYGCIYGWQMCLEEGKHEKEICELNGVETWTEKGWTKLHRIIRHRLAPHKKMIRILTSTGCVDVTDDHSLVLHNGQEISPKDVQIGTKLLHHPIDNLYSLNWYRDFRFTEYCEYFSRDWVYLSKLAIIAQQFGMQIRLNADEESVISLKIQKSFTDTNDTTIQKMCEIPYEGYVYDLTTENHHFAAGIGNIIVHNTDSVFFTFNLENPNTGEKIVGKPALEMTIEIAQDAADLCTQFLKPPMELTYEKTLMPFVLLSKKRYVGMLYETDPNKGKLKYMGLSLKRRDSCDYLKDVYGQILNILMKENSVQKAIDYLEGALSELIKGTVPMDKLTITKALRGDYKNPQQIAHRVLADRIGQRDPGNKPKPGDRMKFVHIVNDMKKALQGDKIETPEYIIANSLQVDYVFYITNQLMKPLQQLFGLALEQIWLNKGKHILIKTFKKDMQKLKEEVDGDIEIFMKKKEKYCSAKIKALLFDKFLTNIYNEKHKIQTITSFFPSSYSNTKNKNI
uniref:DNA-directed DNA polymerase n=1 Tax=viral metagenome TaxID=1070528 RepID=A0A6C0K101_9ZZZZ